MSLLLSGQAINAEKQNLSKDAKSNLTKLAAWINQRNIPFLITSIGMIVMLLWAGSYKMTAPRAEGIVPLVSNSPLIWWHFKLFGPYIGSDIIGLTEITAAILIIAGYMKPKAGIIGGFITTLMFFITSTMVITTPRCDYFRSRNSRYEVHEFFGLVPFQGCHIARSIFLADQLLRQKSHPFGKSKSITKAEDTLGISMFVGSVRYFSHSCWRGADQTRKRGNNWCLTRANDFVVNAKTEGRILEHGGNVTGDANGSQAGVSFELLRRSEQPTAVVHETICEQVHC